MRIALPLLPAAQSTTGHGNYEAVLLDGLLSQHLHSAVLLVPSGRAVQRVRPPHEAIEYKRRRYARPGPVLLDPAMELRTSSVLRTTPIDIVVGNAQWPLPLEPGAPLVTILYEAEIFGQFAWGLYSQAFLRSTAAYIRRNVSRSGAVVTISEHAKDAILRELGLPEHRVFVGPPAVRPFGECTGCTDEIARPYVVAIGWFHPRKDLPLVLAAWAEARNAGLEHDLVLVGSEGPPDRVHGSLARRVLDCTGRHSCGVHMVGQVSRPHLGHLLSRADALLMGSLHEGFGIPAIEAFSLGVPVVAVGRTSLVEVVGRVADLPAPDHRAFATAILQTVSQPCDKAALQAYAATFTAERQLSAVWAAIEAAAS